MAEFNREREAEIERRVRRRIQRRMLLVLNFVLFFGAGMMSSGRYMSPGVSTMLVLWMLAFLAHGVLVIYWEWAERAVRSALEKERNAYYRAIAETVLAELRDEKPKRREHLSLNDDGEFVQPTEYDEQAYRKRR
jgi:hypothetical protein